MDFCIVGGYEFAPRAFFCYAKQFCAERASIALSEYNGYQAFSACRDSNASISVWVRICAKVWGVVAWRTVFFYLFGHRPGSLCEGEVLYAGVGVSVLHASYMNYGDRAFSRLV